MNRFIAWVKRQGDPNSVSYSRFGLPGEETDDRPPPTEILVAPFDETSREYHICRVHVQKAAAMSAGLGISLTLLIFISVFFEFNWYSHTKGVDVLALIGLILFAVCGIITHWHVIVGIKKGHPKYLLPFIVVYIVMISSEGVLSLFGAYHYMMVSTIEINEKAFQSPSHSRMWNDYHTHVSRQMLIGVFVFLTALLVQSMMLYTVLRCRQFLARKLSHDIEMKVAERSKQQHPNIRIVQAPSRPTSDAGSTDEYQAENGGVVNPNHMPGSSRHIGVVNETIGTPPPSYDRSQDQHADAPQPQRTLFTSSEQ